MEVAQAEGKKAQQGYYDSYWSLWDEAKAKGMTVTTISDSDLATAMAIGDELIADVLKDPAVSERGKEIYALFKAH